LAVFSFVLFAAVHESGCGTSPTSIEVCYSVAFSGKADIDFSAANIGECPICDI